jgi:hypothetical protein
VIPWGGSPEVPQKSWEDSGEILGRFWVDSWLIFERFWFDFGRILGRFGWFHLRFFFAAARFRCLGGVEIEREHKGAEQRASSTGVPQQRPSNVPAGPQQCARNAPASCSLVSTGKPELHEWRPPM